MSKYLTDQDIKRLRVEKYHTIVPCKDNYRGKALYLLEFEGGGVKIGIAKNLVNRLRFYKSPWNRKIINSSFYATQQPQRIELQIKQQFRYYCATNSPEFFNININYLRKVIENSELFKGVSEVNRNFTLPPSKPIVKTKIVIKYKTARRIKKYRKGGGFVLNFSRKKAKVVFTGPIKDPWGAVK